MISFLIVGSDRAASKFNKLGGAIKSALRDEVQGAAYIVQREAKFNLTGGVDLYVRTGRLRGSINAEVEEKKGEIVGRVGTNVVYGPVHEFGATIFAKRYPFMLFKIDGRTVAARKVVIPKRPWLSPAMERNRAKIASMFEGRIRLEMNKAGL